MGWKKRKQNKSELVLEEPLENGDGFCGFCKMWEYDSIQDVFLTIDVSGQIGVSLFSDSNNHIFYFNSITQRIDYKNLTSD